MLLISANLENNWMKQNYWMWYERHDKENKNDNNCQLDKMTTTVFNKIYHEI